MAKALLERTPYSLALAKRAANKVFAERFNLTYDLAWSYELLNFFQHGQHVDERGVTHAVVITCCPATVLFACKNSITAPSNAAGSSMQQAWPVPGSTTCLRARDHRRGLAAALQRHVVGAVDHQRRRLHAGEPVAHVAAFARAEDLRDALAGQRSCAFSEKRSSTHAPSFVSQNPGATSSRMCERW